MVSSFSGQNKHLRLLQHVIQRGETLKRNTYCVPKSSAGGWKCRGLPLSREYEDALVERRTGDHSMTWMSQDTVNQTTSFAVRFTHRLFTWVNSRPNWPTLLSRRSAFEGSKNEKRVSADTAENEKDDVKAWQHLSNLSAFLPLRALYLSVWAHKARRFKVRREDLLSHLKLYFRSKSSGKVNQLQSWLDE